LTDPERAAGAARPQSLELPNLGAQIQQEDRVTARAGDSPRKRQRISARARSVPARTERRQTTHCNSDAG